MSIHPQLFCFEEIDALEAIREGFLQQMENKLFYFPISLHTIRLLGVKVPPGGQ